MMHQLLKLKAGSCSIRQLSTFRSNLGLCKYRSIQRDRRGLHEPIPTHAVTRCLSSNHSTGNGSKAHNGYSRPTENVPWLSSLDHWPSKGHPSVVASENFSSALPRDLDAIVVLAGGLTVDGEQPAWAQRRLDTAAGIRAVQNNLDCPILCLGGGTPHKPPVLDGDGYVIHESTSCASYLMEAGGVPAHCILKETSSYDTVGNTYFSLTIHAIPAGWRHVAVVTSEFHMPRTRSLFTTMWPAASRDLLGDPHRFSLTFASATDEGLWDDDVLEARIQKETAAVASWTAKAQSFSSFSDLHTWLFQTHQCYAVPRQHEAHKTTITDKRLLASY